MLKIKRLSETAKLPIKERDSDAGYDLYTDIIEPRTIVTGERAPFSTGIALQIPEGYYGRIAPRSGLALIHGIDVMGGVVDQGYTGEIQVILFNQGWQEYQIQPGDKIAQLIITPYASLDIEEVETIEGDRGEKGFGSSGR